MFKDEPTTEDFEKLGNPDYEEIRETVKQGIKNKHANNSNNSIDNFTNIFYTKKTLTKEEVYIQMITWLGEIYNDEFDRDSDSKEKHS